MQDWQRGDWFDSTNLPWINPSPNMRSLNAAMLYPGTLPDGIRRKNCSVGRGTDAPFEQMGADFIERPGTGRVSQQAPDPRRPRLSDAASPRRSRTSKASASKACASSSPTATCSMPPGSGWNSRRRCRSSIPERSISPLSKRLIGSDDVIRRAAGRRRSAHDPAEFSGPAGVLCEDARSVLAVSL